MTPIEIYQFNIHLPWFNNIDHNSLYYKRYCIKTWYFKVYEKYMLIIPENYMTSSRGAFDTKHLLNARIIKVYSSVHLLTIPECMKIISRHWYLPYIKRYQRHCELIERRKR